MILFVGFCVGGGGLGLLVIKEMLIYRRINYKFIDN